MDIFPKIPATATFSQIQLTQAADPKGLHVVLEGQDDVAFLNRLFLVGCTQSARVHVKWVSAHGRPNCLRVHQLCITHGTEGVLFVIDADFDRKLNLLESLEAVAYTDRNDMECTVLEVDPVLDRLHEQYGDKDVVQQLLECSGCLSVFEVAVERASRFGKYRFVDRRDRLSLRFKNPKPNVEPPYETFLCHDDKFLWDDDAFRAWVRQRNHDTVESAEKVRLLFAAVDRLPQAEEDDLEWCQGHDLIALHAVIHNRLVAKTEGDVMDGRGLEEFVRRNVEPSRVRTAEVIRRIEDFVGWQLLGGSGAESAAHC